jgi:hypothetical protein
MVSLLVLGKKTSGKMAVSFCVGIDATTFGGFLAVLMGAAVVSIIGTESFTSCDHTFSPDRIIPNNNRYFNISCKNIHLQDQAW